jgi:hypothetical protein
MGAVQGGEHDQAEHVRFGLGHQDRELVEVRVDDHAARLGDLLQTARAHEDRRRQCSRERERIRVEHRLARVVDREIEVREDGTGASDVEGRHLELIVQVRVAVEDGDEATGRSIDGARDPVRAEADHELLNGGGIAAEHRVERVQVGRRGVVGDPTMTGMPFEKCSDSAG